MSDASVTSSSVKQTRSSLSADRQMFTAGGTPKRQVIRAKCGLISRVPPP